MLRNVKTVFGDSLSENEINKARVLLAIMVFNLALTFPDSVFNCYVIAHERFVFQKFLSLVQNIINPFLALPLLLMGFGSIGLVCVTTFLTVLRFSVDVWFCLKKLHMKFIFKGIQLHLIKEMWVFTFFIFLNQIIDCINWSIDKFLLGRLAGTTAVAIYGIGSQINQMYLDFSTAISNVFVPQVNRLIAEKSEDSDINRIFIKVGRIQFMILMLVLTGFVFFGKAFIRYWAGVGYEVSYYVTLLLIVPVTIPLIQNLGIEIQRAKNKHKARSVVYFLIAIVNVFISVPFIKLLGAAGAALGTAIALCAGNVVFINWYYHKKIGLDICNFWKQIASFMPAMAAPVALGIIIMRFVVISNLLYLLLYALLYSVVYCLSILCLGMNKDEKRMILSPIKRIFRRC